MTQHSTRSCVPNAHGRYVHASGLVAAVVYPLRMAVVLQGLVAGLRPGGSPLVDEGLVIPVSALSIKALRADVRKVSKMCACGLPTLACSAMSATMPWLTNCAWT